jgi:hypothetical protein
VQIRRAQLQLPKGLDPSAIKVDVQGPYLPPFLAPLKTLFNIFIGQVRVVVDNREGYICNCQGEG